MRKIVFLIMLIPASLGSLFIWTAAVIMSDSAIYAQMSLNAILCLIAGILCFVPVIGEIVMGLVGLIKKKKRISEESL